MKRYLYYPGCSLRGTGKAYEESLLAVFKALDVELEELEDWNCCGAMAQMPIDEVSSFALAGRNLAIAEKRNLDLLAPCSACFLVLNKAQHYFKEDSKVAQTMEHGFKAAGLEYHGTTKVRHPLDVLVNDIGLERIKACLKKPLTGLKVAPYYGCQIVRPYATFDLMYYPVTMDKLLRAVGAEVVDYPLKTRCCGGSQEGTLPEVGLSLIHILLKEARRRDAHILSTICPLCQFNLDAFQDEASKKYGQISMPVVYFTQLLGLAFGFSAKELGLERNIVAAKHLLAKFAPAAA
ncbi:MAG: CoB--CoM heterodisulfide reductase iron-sulfur subunit B family protein [Terriglobia bacterium]